MLLGKPLRPSSLEKRPAAKFLSSAAVVFSWPVIFLAPNLSWLNSRSTSIVGSCPGGMRSAASAFTIGWAFVTTLRPSSPAVVFAFTIACSENSLSRRSIAISAIPSSGGISARNAMPVWPPKLIFCASRLIAGISILLPSSVCDHRPAVGYIQIAQGKGDFAA